MTQAFKTLIAAAVLVVPIAAAPALYAQDSGASQAPHESMMKPGMMGGGMMNMMGGTSQMQDMMGRCSQMMNGGSTRPNDQWRSNTTPAPGDQE